MTQRTYIGDERRRQDDEHYFNAQFDAKPVYCTPGDSIFSAQDREMVIATVGSGVAVSFYDDIRQIGALAYVLLSPTLLQAFPYFKDIEPSEIEDANRPLADAIKQMMDQGSEQSLLRIRIMGASVLDIHDGQDSGMKNFIFAQEYINRQGLKITHTDIGDTHVRRIHFFPKTGKAVRCVLRRDYDYDAIYDLEKSAFDI